MTWNMAAPYGIAPGQGVRSTTLTGDFMTGSRIITKAGPEETAGQFSLLEVVFAKGNDAPTHMHTREDEAFYILDGEFTVQVGGKKIIATPGNFVWAPRNIRHRYTVTGATDVRAMVVISPGGFERFFDVAAEARIGGPEDMEQMLVLARNDWGVEIYLDDLDASGADAAAAAGVTPR